jgi:hypothetical protein
MSKLWRAAGAVAIVVLSLVGFFGSSVSAAECSPGHHGNPHPGFKPGSC